MSHMQSDVVSYVPSVKRIHSHAHFDYLTWPAMTRLTREIIVWIGNRVQFIWETKRACIFTSQEPTRLNHGRTYVLCMYINSY